MGTAQDHQRRQTAVDSGGALQWKQEQPEKAGGLAARLQEMQQQQLEMQKKRDEWIRKDTSNKFTAANYKS